MPKIKPLYSPHPGLSMVRKWVETLPEKTGRALDQWLEFIKQEGPATEKERREWLKTACQLGTNSCW